MLCCLHSSFLGELTFVAAYILKCNNAGFRHFSALHSVQGNTLFQFVGTPPKLKKQQMFGYLGLPIYHDVWQGHRSSIHEKLHVITAVL